MSDSSHAPILSSAWIDAETARIKGLGNTELLEEALSPSCVCDDWGTSLQRTLFTNEAVAKEFKERQQAIEKAARELRAVSTDVLIFARTHGDLTTTLRNRSHYL